MHHFIKASSGSQVLPKCPELRLDSVLFQGDKILIPNIPQEPDLVKLNRQFGRIDLVNFWDNVPKSRTRGLNFTVYFWLLSPNLVLTTFITIFSTILPLSLMSLKLCTSSYLLVLGYTIQHLNNTEVLPCLLISCANTLLPAAYFSY